jgi:3-hydroxyacyl-CoA dehydrogenase
MNTAASPNQVRRVGIVGGGIMGTGIAEVCVRAERFAAVSGLGQEQGGLDQWK